MLDVVHPGQGAMFPILAGEDDGAAAFYLHHRALVESDRAADVGIEHKSTSMRPPMGRKLTLPKLKLIGEGMYAGGLRRGGTLAQVFF